MVEKEVANRSAPAPTLVITLLLPIAQLRHPTTASFQAAILFSGRHIAILSTGYLAANMRSFSLRRSFQQTGHRQKEFAFGC